MVSQREPQRASDIIYLHEDSATVELPASPTRQGLDELVASGLLWSNNPQPVDNLWEKCSQRGKGIPFGAPEIDSLLASNGISRGAIHEFYYRDPDKYVRTPRALPTLLARNAFDSFYASPESAWERHERGAPPFFIAWIGRGCWPTPFALPQHLLSSCLFIDPPTEKLTLWAIETALRSPLISLTIAECPRIPMITTRRLSLSAKRTENTAILLRPLADLTLPSSCATKWSLAPLTSPHDVPLWTLTLERNKGGSLPTTSWTIGLESTYEEREAISLRVLPRVVDRDHEEERKAQRFG